jgi:hypothetical protein
MGFDRWAVLPSVEEDEYELMFMDSNATPGQSLGNMQGPFSEEEIRVELKKQGKTEDEINSAMARAKAKREDDRKKSR